MSINKKPIKKILWAVNPFSQEKTLQRSAALKIKNLIPSSGAIIEPIYFLSATALGSNRNVPKELIQKAQLEGQRKLNEIVSGIDLAGLRRLRIIPASRSTIRAGVDKITRLAKKWPADLIVTSTNEHKGLRHFGLGSFSETLLLYSDVPLLFVNAHIKTAQKNRDIFFPSDFSKESKGAFLEVLNLAKSLGSQVTLFHKIDYFWPPTIQLNARALKLYKRTFHAEFKAKRELAKTWENLAKNRGVLVKTIIESKRNGSLVETILKQSKKCHGIVAMAARSGPVRTALLGSTIRSVVRASSLPVWVLHPRSKASIETREPLYTLTAQDIESDLYGLPHGTRFETV